MSLKLLNASKEALVVLLPSLLEEKGSLPPKGSVPKSPKRSVFALLVGVGLFDLGGAGRGGGCLLDCFGGSAGIGDSFRLAGDEGANGSPPKGSPPDFWH